MAEAILAPVFSNFWTKGKNTLAQHFFSFCVELAFAFVIVGLVYIDYIKWWKLISSLCVHSQFQKYSRIVSRISFGDQTC